VFRDGIPSGVPPETIASIRETRVALKGPLETPIGFGPTAVMLSADMMLRHLDELAAASAPPRRFAGRLASTSSSRPKAARRSSVLASPLSPTGCRSS